MKLFSICVNGYGEEKLATLYSLLQHAVRRRLHKSKRIEWRRDPDRKMIVCLTKKSLDLVEKQNLYEWTAHVLAQFVLDHLQEEILEKWIREEHDTMDQQQQDKLRSYCLQLWHDCEFDEVGEQHEHHRKEMMQGFYRFLQMSEHLHLQGYIRFRLKSYVDDLRSFLDYAVEEFSIDRQYEDFIALLKYFVCEQEAKSPAVHIYHQQGNEFIVLDEQYRPIKTEQSDGLVMETIDQEINLEDMILSTLITVSPRMVYIHTKEPEMQVIRTIKLIFEERAVLCP